MMEISQTDTADLQRIWQHFRGQLPFHIEDIINLSKGTPSPFKF